MWRLDVSSEAELEIVQTERLLAVTERDPSRASQNCLTVVDLVERCRCEISSRREFFAHAGIATDDDGGRRFAAPATAASG